MVIDPI